MIYCLLTKLCVQLQVSTVCLMSAIVKCDCTHLVRLPRSIADAHREHSVGEVCLPENLLHSVHGRNLLLRTVHQVMCELDHGHLIHKSRINWHRHQVMHYSLLRQIWRVMYEVILLQQVRTVIFGAGSPHVNPSSKPRSSLCLEPTDPYRNLVNFLENSSGSKLFSGIPAKNNW